MGKNGSGKSAFAEKLTVNAKGERYYLATMLPYGRKDASRVHKHTAQRAGLGFITLELPYAVSAADIPAESAALLEDVANLLSNAMFDKGLTALEVFDDIMGLRHRVSCVVAVTISEFDDGDYDQETLEYIRSLTELNRRLSEAADAVIEMRGGAPVVTKGESRLC
jgi:adenosylcobinamide kinase/adenosylcobinamide-phosphate guanylyltransferase